MVRAYNFPRKRKVIREAVSRTYYTKQVDLGYTRDRLQVYTPRSLLQKRVLWVTVQKFALAKHRSETQGHASCLKWCPLPGGSKHPMTHWCRNIKAHTPYIRVECLKGHTSTRAPFGDSNLLGAFVTAFDSFYCPNLPSLFHRCWYWERSPKDFFYKQTCAQNLFPRELKDSIYLPAYLLECVFLILMYINSIFLTGSGVKVLRKALT